MDALFTVLEETPTMIQKESHQLKRLLKTNNMSLESLRISNQSVRERCRQLEAKLEKEKAISASLNQKLHHAAALRCEMDEKAARSEHQIHKISKRNTILGQEVLSLTKHVEEQSLAIMRDQQQKAIWQTAFEQHKEQKLELIEKIVKLERKLHQKNQSAHRKAAIKDKAMEYFSKPFDVANNFLAKHLKANILKVKFSFVMNALKVKIDLLKRSFSSKHAEKKRKVSKIKRKKYWERTKVVNHS